LIVPNEAAIFLPLSVARFLASMPEPSRATSATVASEPSLVALPL
jgi:hypothetical protein